MTAPKKRPAHRPPKYPGEQMTQITIRMPVRLKEKLLRLSCGRTGEWVCDRLEKARDRENETKRRDSAEGDGVAVDFRLQYLVMRLQRETRGW
jgi:hypothetical protein